MDSRRRLVAVRPVPWPLHLLTSRRLRQAFAAGEFRRGTQFIKLAQAMSTIGLEAVYPHFVKCRLRKMTPGEPLPPVTGGRD